MLKKQAGNIRRQQSKASKHVKIQIRYLEYKFAKLLGNFCSTQCKNFLSLRISFAGKNINLRNYLQKSFHAKFCATRVLNNSAISLKSYMCISWNWKVFSQYLNFGKILFWNVLLLVTFTYLTNDSKDKFGSHGRTPYSLVLRPWERWRGLVLVHTYFLKVDSSGIGYFLAKFYMW